MLKREPLWYKDAVIYELHVRAFHDSLGEGTGDFRGLSQKLDYLQDLGVTAIWVLPFYPSPLRDDGYDIADYTSINRDYGTLEAFQEFLEAAHARGLRVITELVINHTSDQHPWFQRARRAPPGSVERDFYVWSDAADKYADARIIFKDFETSNWTWDKVAQSHYWHRFYSHQPDLNFDNRAVWDALFPIADFWLGMGVDGVRLDAIPYLYEREGTNCENLPETHAFLKAFRAHVDEKWPDRMLLAEANQWPEDSIAYFGDGDECHMAFHFPVMPRLFMAMHTEDRLPIIDIMEQTPTIPENCQWAMFLRNHDELTLEMVTDEERDYMYQAYATDPRARINLGIRRRLAPLLGNNRRRIELMNGLLFSLPGTPVLYYGDEIGMGDNIYLGDRNGVRTPMQWSADRNAGFSRANPQKLYLPIIIDPEYHYEAINVEAQQNNLNSLLWWMKRLIGIRRQHRAFSRGRMEFLRPVNRHILAFLRITEDETILVVANLSRFVQYAELDLSAYEGAAPVELFGGTRFPPVGKSPYFLMLGPHSFYWFSLAPQMVPSGTGTGGAGEAPAEDLPAIFLSRPWEQLPTDPSLDQLEPILLGDLRRSRLSGGDGRPLRNLRISDCVPLAYDSKMAYLLICELDIVGARAERTWIPLLLIDEEMVAAGLGMSADAPPRVLARVVGRAAGLLVDGRSIPSFERALLDVVREGRQLRGHDNGIVTGVPNRSHALAADDVANLPVRPLAPGGSSSSVLLGEQIVLTEFQRVEVTPRPELELGRWLTESRSFAYAPQWLGAIEYRRRRDEPMILASVTSFVINEGTAWQLTLDELSSFFDRVLALPEALRASAPLPVRPEYVSPAPLPVSPSAPGRTDADPYSDIGAADSAPHALAPDVLATVGSYLETARSLGRRLADLHIETTSGVDDPNFAPEPYGTQYQRSLYQSLRNLAVRTLHELRARLDTLPDEFRAMAQALSNCEPAIDRHFHQLAERPIPAWRVRIHGDCHLGHFVRSGRELVLTDFESGGRSVGERRIKRSPIRDVAGMLHSFEYVSISALNGISSRRGQAVGVVRPEDYDLLAQWRDFWSGMVKQTFADGYREAVAGRKFLDQSQTDFDLLCDAFLLEQGLKDVLHHLIDRPSTAGTALEIALRHLGRMPDSTPPRRVTD
ncbi:maltose alpha-D-glucosyltransferase [Planctomyces sp. SH-PL14]|uniref:maltose alpha-D-glucosyltransferase n=1 Tax=Planctomyces sp. SH-PL14 TaxID=1632864 RepID=UPI00078CB9BD|nr:maltose alpha-D-glucosyltransferase [Planctomyces sp. SH-PL14]AMV22590.1 Trehalose synthase/amylase TreS [Planctomyces sp. SH-PL14]